MNTRFNTAAVIVTAVLTFPVLSQASLLLGTLSTTGTIQITTGNINFVSPPSTPGAGTLANPGTGTLRVDAPAAAQIGDFQVLSGTTATIKNIEHVFAPVNTPLSLPNFLTFSAAPNISFELTLLPQGIRGSGQCFSAPAAGQLCTPDLPDPSPFNLANITATSSTASFRIVGIEHDSLTGNSVAVTGLFAATFDNQNYQTLLAQVSGTGTPGQPGYIAPGAVTTGFTATFTTAPEPGSLFLMATGAMLLGIGAVKKRNRRSA